MNPIRLRSASSQNPVWKSNLNTFTFPDTYSTPETPANYFTNTFDFPYLAQGSNPEEAISSIDGKKSNRENEIDSSKASLDDCHEECDQQGCYGKGPTKCVSCRNKRLDKYALLLSLSLVSVCFYCFYFSIVCVERA